MVNIHMFNRLRPVELSNRYSPLLPSRLKLNPTVPPNSPISPLFADNKEQHTMSHSIGNFVTWDNNDTISAESEKNRRNNRSESCDWDETIDFRKPLSSLASSESQQTNHYSTGHLYQYNTNYSKYSHGPTAQQHLHQQSHPSSDQSTHQSPSSRLVNLRTNHSNSRPSSYAIWEKSVVHQQAQPQHQILPSRISHSTLPQELSQNILSTNPSSSSVQHLGHQHLNERRDASSSLECQEDNQRSPRRNVAEVEERFQEGTSSRRAGNFNLDRLFASEDMRLQFLDNVPNVLLTGLSRSGKTSISEVVYRKTSPHETLFMAQTQTPQILRVANTNLIQFNLVDCPGSLLQDSSMDYIFFSNAQSLIFVIDAQNEPFGAEIAHCKDLFKRAWKVFIHKVDGDFFSVDEVRQECQRDIHDKLMSYLHEAGVSANVVFYSTSIYDQTIFEACSRVIQRLIPNIETLERLLDILVASCKMEKAFLIDVLSKTFIATDSSPFDPFNYELCTDMVDVVIEISCIYGDVDCHDSLVGQLENEKHLTDEGELEGASAGFPRTLQSENHCETCDRVCSFTMNSESSNRGQLPLKQNHTDTITCNDDTQGSTLCLIQLNTGHILYLREVDRLLALACVVREENFDRQYLVDHNIRVFRDAMLEFFSRQTMQSSSTSVRDS